MISVTKMYHQHAPQHSPKAHAATGVHNKSKHKTQKPPKKTPRESGILA
jgi:hypothetical protein